MPDRAGAEYELALEVGGETITWSVVVPEQRVEARFDSYPQLVRRGQMGFSIPAHTDWPLRIRVPEHTKATEFPVRDEPPVDYSSLLRAGTWNGVRPGASRASARSLLGEPDQRHNDDRVWGYGDLDLHFLGDTLQSFAGRVIPDELLDDLTAEDRVGSWTEQLDTGAQLRVERPHRGTYVRLVEFSLTS